jgi:hypothetical protein
MKLNYLSIICLSVFCLKLHSQDIAYKNNSFKIKNPLKYYGGYLWDFGDGTTSSGDSISHIFTDTGLFKVTVIGYETCLNNEIYDTSSFAIRVINNPSDYLNIVGNPYNTETTFHLKNLESGSVSLFVTDFNGNNVHALHNGTLAVGDRSYAFSAKNLGLGHGTYFLHYSFNEFNYVFQLIELP